jgi:hypothetical protein
MIGMSDYWYSYDDDRGCVANSGEPEFSMGNLTHTRPILNRRLVVRG